MNSRGIDPRDPNYTLRMRFWQRFLLDGGELYLDLRRGSNGDPITLFRGRPPAVNGEQYPIITLWMVRG